MFAKQNSNLLINLVFAFLPISFVLGSGISNINYLIFCCIGIFFLKTDILKENYDNYIKIIFLFFFIIFFSTLLSLAKALYFNEYDSSNLDRLIKSILFFRYFLFLIIVYLLNKFDLLNFKYFILSSSCVVILLSMDVIYQYTFGEDIIGFKSFGLRNGGFFGDEYVAGAYIQRFSFFSILLTSILFINKNYIKYLSIIILITLLSTAILVSGNRMPLVLFLFGLFLLFWVDIKIKKILILSFISFLTITTLLFYQNADLKNFYKSYSTNVVDIFSIPIDHWNKKIKKRNETKEEKIQEDFELSKPKLYRVGYTSMHRRLFLTAIDTWKMNKIFGNGIKSFRIDCSKLGQDVNLEEDFQPYKKNRLCSNHPHNYYLEILTETGMVGILGSLIILIFTAKFIIKNYKLLEKSKTENFILLAAVISLVLELFPLRSSGSFFTSSNANYVMLIFSIILCHKNLLKIKTQ